MDTWGVGFLALSEVEGLLRGVFSCWPAERRDGCWLAAYRRASNVLERWEAQIEAELASQGAIVEDPNDDGALPTQSSTRKERKEGATRVGGGHHASTGDSLVDALLATKIAAVDELLQEAHAKGRRKEGNSP